MAYEEAHEMEGFSRRVRITAGNIEQLREIKGLIWPPRPFVLFCLLSHKTGRLLVPVFMLIALARTSSCADNSLTTGCCWASAFLRTRCVGRDGQPRPKFSGCLTTSA